MNDIQKLLVESEPSSRQKFITKRDMQNFLNNSRLVLSTKNHQKFIELVANVDILLKVKMLH